jgi:hypothetical protein
MNGNGLWWGWNRRAGDTEGFDVEAGIWGGAKRGNSCRGVGVSNHALCDAARQLATYRTLKLGTLAAAAFDNVLNADVCVPQLLL